MDIRIRADNIEKLKKMIRQNGQRALIAAGIECVGCIKEKMQSGYGKPIKITGTLMGSIAKGEPYINGNKTSIDIGTIVEYGKFVHEGTSKMRSRPFIRDGIMENEARISRILQQELQRETD